MYGRSGSNGHSRATDVCRRGELETMGEEKSCHCLKSRCLKLYCDCFARGAYCAGCACADCHNCEENASLVAERRAGIRDKNPEVLHMLTSDN